MKGNRKGFWAGMLTMLLIVSLVGTAVATTGKVTKELEYRNISVTLDGKKLDLKDATGKAVEPFMFEGTNYLPVRALAESLGLEVAWNGATNTVVLTSPGNSTAPVAPASGTYSRTNPAPVGTPQTVTVEEYWGSYTATVEITNAFRGQTAWAAIREANRYNATPTSEREYILAAVKVTVDSVSEDRAINMSKYDFTAFSSSNAEYDTVATVNPSPEFTGSAYEGASVEGFVSFVVDTNDTAPKVVYGNNYDGTGGVWFSLVE